MNSLLHSLQSSVGNSADDIAKRLAIAEVPTVMKAAEFLTVFKPEWLQLFSQWRISPRKIERLLSDYRVCAELHDWYGYGSPASLRMSLTRELRYMLHPTHPFCQQYVFEGKALGDARSYVQKYGLKVGRMRAAPVVSFERSLASALQTVRGKVNISKHVLILVWMLSPKLELTPKEFLECTTPSDLVDILCSRLSPAEIVRLLVGPKADTLASAEAQIFNIMLQQGYLTKARKRVNITPHGLRELGR